VRVPRAGAHYPKADRDVVDVAAAVMADRKLAVAVVFGVEQVGMDQSPMTVAPEMLRLSTGAQLLPLLTER